MTEVVSNLVLAMEQIAPTAHAEPWDRVGLLVGDPFAEFSRLMLCIDLTSEVVAEAVGAGCGAVVAYHPPIFKKAEAVLAGTPVYEAVRGGLSVYTPHTALDVAAGGTNDVLADALCLSDRRPLRPRPAAESYKFVTFVPPADADRVANALFAAGAGHVGDYGRCSFRGLGVGTFFGGEGTKPAVGRPGLLQMVEEIRLEVPFKSPSLAAVLAAVLRAEHPYEEPSFDVVKLAGLGPPVGMGRFGLFEEPVPRDVLIGRVKRELGLEHLLVAGPTDGDVQRVAVCAGSCGDLWEEATRQGADFYLTGEMRHHDALEAAAYGMTVVCVLHSNSERATLKRLKDRLADLLPDVDVRLSERDRDPFRIL